MEAVVTSRQREELTNPEALVVHLGPLKSHLSDDEFFEFCALNSDLRIEMTKEGEMIIMLPCGSEGGPTERISHDRELLDLYSTSCKVLQGILNFASHSLTPGLDAIIGKGACVPPACKNMEHRAVISRGDGIRNILHVRRISP